MTERAKLAISITGLMCFWSGVMELLQASGLAERLSRLMAPVLRPLFVLGILFYFRPAWLLSEDRQQADGVVSKVRTVSAAAVVCAMVMTVICVIG